MTFFELLAYAVPHFLNGGVITLKLAAISLLVGAGIGIPLAFIRVYGKKSLQNVVIGFAEILRGTPVLVQLFLIYYGFPQIGITWSSNLCAIIILSLNSAAFQIEYLRAAIEAVGNKQMEAARSIGMTRTKAMMYIIIPQAIRIVLPNWSNEAIAMIKNTGIVYTIAVVDVMGETRRIISKFYNPIESYAAVALFYLVLVTVLSLFFNYIERKLRIPGLVLEDKR